MCKLRFLPNSPERICGIDLGSTGCTHDRNDLASVALLCKCCHKHYACYRCHNKLESHLIERGTLLEFNKDAILCRRCQHSLTVEAYFACQAPCNPGWKKRWERYFEGINRGGGDF